MGKHLAAWSLEKGAQLVVRETDTPDIGPKEILLETKAIALNPVDYYQRDFGYPFSYEYPAIFGNDVSGIVLKIGADVTDLKPGMRVCAFASSFFLKEAKYASFQDRIVIPEAGVTPIPDHVSFQEASTIPLCLVTAWQGLVQLGFDPDRTISEKQILLVWGGSSSVGTSVIQAAKILGLTVYTTASKKNHEYMKSLGADKVFDYHDDTVVEDIIEFSKKSKIDLFNAYLASGDLLLVQKIIETARNGKPGNIVSAANLPKEYPDIDGVTVSFVYPSSSEEYLKLEERVLTRWLKNNLVNGKYKPSPPPIPIEGGLEKLNFGLDSLRDKGASASKYVVLV